MKFKSLFLDAIARGELGSIDDQGITVSLKEFEQSFPDIRPKYLDVLFPSVTLEPEQKAMTQNKFLYHIQKDIYLVHPDALEEYNQYVVTNTSVKFQAKLN